jgi:hypothetical protein
MPENSQVVFVPSRRAFLASAAGSVSIGLAGCQSIPFVGCQRTDATPPANTAFSLTWETDDGDDVLYVRYDDGPVLDDSNTGHLEAFVRINDGGDIAAPWYDHTEPTAQEGEPSHMGRQPVRPGDTRLIGRPMWGDEWDVMQLLWGPPTMDGSPRRCELAIVEEWPDRPEPP